MRAYRFVNALGSAVESAGRNVADAADVTSAHQGGLSADPVTAGPRLSEELLRQIARHVTDTTLDRVEIESRAVTAEDSVEAGIGLDVALSIHIDLPAYETTNVALGTVIHTSQLPANERAAAPTPARERVQSLAERTSSAFLLLVGDDRTRVIAAQSLLGLSEPVTKQAIDRQLYGRSLGRFAEQLAEGFLGVDGRELDVAGPLDPDQDGQLRSWVTAQSLDGVCAIRVTPRRNRTESSLADFLD